MTDKKELMRGMLNRKQIRDKGGFYLFYEISALGNPPKAWHTYQEIINSGWEGDVCIRAREIGDWKTRYNIPLKKLRQKINSIVKNERIPESELTFNQSMPDQHLTIQGEISVVDFNTCLRYTTVAEPMKRALKKETKHIQGREADRLLRANLFPTSLDDISTIQEMFPKAAIEFSSYRFPVGEFPGRNTIIWEVRDY